MTQAALLATTISQFVAGCKTDGIWDPIKACCIMAAWDGLAGALYPLKGPAPTNNNFVAGDYDRETGLKGSTSNTLFLDSNFALSSLYQNNAHAASYVTEIPVVAGVRCDLSSGAGFLMGPLDTNQYYARINTGGSAVSITQGVPAFYGMARSASAESVYRLNGQTGTIVAASTSVAPTTIRVFGRPGASQPSPNRLAFYSIGESLDLEKLDTRVTRLIQQTAFSINTGLDGSIYDIDTLRYVNAGYAAGGTLT